ncbi:hypothetical protein Tco_0694217 [Tanacetum coccineum]
MKSRMMLYPPVRLAPQRQEMSVKNVTPGLVPQGKKASDYDKSAPVPSRQNVVPSAEKLDSYIKGVRIFSFSPLLEEYNNPTYTIKMRKTNNDQAPECIEEGIDFEESFAQVARLEAVRIFVARSTQVFSNLSNGRCKRPFLNGTLKEEHAQGAGRMKLFQSLMFHKALLKVSIDPTFIQDNNGEDILLVQIYVDDIIFAFSDADHAGCIDTRKSTSRGIQFLGDKTCKLDVDEETKMPAMFFCKRRNSEYQLVNKFTKDLPEDFGFKYLSVRIGYEMFALQ